MKAFLHIATTICVALLITGAVAAQSFSIGSADGAGALAIPDDDPVGVSETFIVSFPDMMIVSTEDATLQVTHTWVGDLIWTITSPEGTQVVVMDQPGVPASTFGCDGDDIDVAINDAGTAGPVEDMCDDLPAIHDDPTPNNPLSAFDGEDPNGNWTMNMSDNAAGDTGTVDAWNLSFTLGPIVANEPVAELPEGFSVSSAYPNPFNPQTQFVVQVGETQHVVADVYNALGQQVARIFDDVIASGQQESLTFEAGNLPSGLYMVRITGDQFVTTRRVSLLK